MGTVTSAVVTVVKLVSTGSTVTGPVSAQGLEVGDTVMKIFPGGFDQGFEVVVSAANQLQQLANLDWSNVNFTFYLIRGV